AFKRPVRVTVPRALPTDDVLVVRERRGDAGAPKRAQPLGPPVAQPWKGAVSADLIESSAAIPASGTVAVIASSLDEVRGLATRAIEHGALRVVVAPFVPSGIAHLLAGAGVAVFVTDDAGREALRGQKSLALPGPAQWSEPIAIVSGKGKAT